MRPRHFTPLGFSRAKAEYVLELAHSELDLGTLDDAGMTRLRRDRIGFVFQSFNLVPTLTGGENIALPAALAGRKVDQEWFGYLVKELGIA